MDQLSDGLLSSGAIGAGAGGLAAIAFLLLLLLLLKKKKVAPESAVETVEVDTTGADTLEYISEYGLSDGLAHNVDSGDEAGHPSDVPHEPSDFVSDDINASEHNPDDFEGFADDAGES